MEENQASANQTFGEFFRNKRLDLGLTLRSFCDLYHYDPGNISRLERNILTPTIDEEKLKSYAIALKIKPETEEWIRFFDLAHTARGVVPPDIKNNPKLFPLLPAFYRTMRGEKLSKDKVDELIRLLNNAQSE